MLVQFSFKNFLSFKEETVLDMSAISAYKEHEYNLLSLDTTKERFLKVAAVYGANASGKSNLIFAYDFFKSIVKDSSNNIASDEETAISEWYNPFSLCEDNANTEFELVEIIDNFEYKYGFEYNEEQIESEWLYKKNLTTHRTVTIFERDADCRIVFGGSVRKECDLFREQVGYESLVLSFYNRLKLETTVFKDVYDAIVNRLVLDSDFGSDMDMLKKLLPLLLKSKPDKEKFVRFLHAVDTGIQDIRCLPGEKKIHLYTVHLGKDGHNYELPLSNESEGTLKCITLYIFMDIAIRKGQCLLIDELNGKLHPLLLKFLIDLFHEEGSRGQLIYTTHDTTLLDKKFFRRDQIWFVEKDTYGCSRLYALSDFKVRSDASFEKDYLGGVYGGIPMLKDFEMKEVK